MYYCDFTLSTPEENLAADEVLLDWCEEGNCGEILRIWEPRNYFVVVGYGNKVNSEVNRKFCEAERIPILRRVSGGGTVLQGAGILNYSLILKIEEANAFRSIHSTNTYILNENRTALANLLRAPVEVRGHTDLAVGGLKFNGNAQRRKKHFLIFHGAFLLNLDIEKVERTLLMPPTQPEYRFNRSHSDFLMNLKVPPAMLKNTLRERWDADIVQSELPRERISGLASEKYSREDWNKKF
jgi:lipoate-protein ligase A